MGDSVKDWEARALELLPGPFRTTDGARKAMLQLGHEMADARAKEIAQTLDSFGSVPLSGRCAADIARSTITPPKTRELALEEALRYILAGPNFVHPGYDEAFHRSWCSLCRSVDDARRALEWKP
jgi:hypothetical protein